MNRERWNVRRWLSSLQRMVRPFIAWVVALGGRCLTPQSSSGMCNRARHPKVSSRTSPLFRWGDWLTGRINLRQAFATEPSRREDSQAEQELKSRIYQDLVLAFDLMMCGVERPNDKSSATRPKGKL